MREQPGRKRSLQTDRKILDVTLEVLREVGYSDFTVHAVIKRAGVSSATLYRRWGSAHQLLIAALKRLGPAPACVDTGSFEGDIGEFVDYLGRAMASFGDLAAIESRHKVDRQFREQVAETFVAPRIAVLSEILDCARARGELGSFPSTRECWDFIAGPIHHRLYVNRRDYTPDFAATIKKMLCTGLKALYPPEPVNP